MPRDLKDATQNEDQVHGDDVNLATFLYEKMGQGPT